MGINNLRKNVAYGFSDPLLDVSPGPIVAARIPTANDMAPIGQLWVVPSANSAYILTSIVSNVAHWNIVT